MAQKEDRKPRSERGAGAAANEHGAPSGTATGKRPLPTAAAPSTGEEDFPRGGSDGLTALERREAMEAAQREVERELAEGKVPKAKKPKLSNKVCTITQHYPGWSLHCPGTSRGRHQAAGHAAAAVCCVSKLPWTTVSHGAKWNALLHTLAPYKGCLPLPFSPAPLCCSPSRGVVARAVMRTTRHCWPRGRAPLRGWRANWPSTWRCCGQRCGSRAVRCGVEHPGEVAGHFP